MDEMVLWLTFSVLLISANECPRLSNIMIISRFPIIARSVGEKRSPKNGPRSFRSRRRKTAATN